MLLLPMLAMGRCKNNGVVGLGDPRARLDDVEFSRLSIFEIPTDAVADSPPMLKEVIMLGEVARGVVECDRCSSVKMSKSRGVMGLGMPGMYPGVTLSGTGE